MDVFIGLDVGTSAVKGVLLSSEGEQVAVGKRTTRLLSPQPGFVEVEPEEHYRSVCELIRELSSHAPSGATVRAISMAFASGNTLLLDRDDKPLINIISWMDKRGSGKLKDILPGLDPESVHGIAGWPLRDGWFPLAHLGWLKKYRPEIYGRAARYCMNSDWLMYRLSGRWGMDYSTASTFYLVDQVNCRWHKPYLDMLEIPEEAVSKLGPSGSVLGPLTRQGAEDTGLNQEVLVVLGAFDHPSAARGTGFTNVGDLLLSCGTSWVGFYPIEDRNTGISQGVLVDPFLVPEGPWAAIISIPEIGRLIDWYIENQVLQEGDDSGQKYELFSSRAEKVPPGSQGAFIDPFTNMKELASSEIDLPARYAPAEVARAVMEGPALRMRYNIERLAEAGIKADRIAMVGGPAENPVWPRIVAEITGLELKLINGQTAGAVGAAILAAVGAGLFEDEREAFSAMGGEGTVIIPSAAAVDVYDSIYERFLEKYVHEQV
jgi:sugar (pentulose or hexulose) kinase